MISKSILPFFLALLGALPTLAHAEEMTDSDPKDLMVAYAKAMRPGSMNSLVSLQGDWKLASQWTAEYQFESQVRALKIITPPDLATSHRPGTWTGARVISELENESGSSRLQTTSISFRLNRGFRWSLEATEWECRSGMWQDQFALICERAQGRDWIRPTLQGYLVFFRN
jgi:hypothetical protein